MTYGEFVAEALQRGASIEDAQFEVQPSSKSSYDFFDFNVIRKTNAFLQGKLVGQYNHWHKTGAFF